MGTSHLPLKILIYLYNYASYPLFDPQNLVLKWLHTINKQDFCNLKQVTPVYVVDSPLIDATVGYWNLDILLPLRKGCDHYMVENNKKMCSFE